MFKFEWYLSVIPIIILLLAVLFYLGYTSGSHWTGFGNYGLPKKESQRAKTLWDWLQLLIISATLTLVVIWFNYQQNQTNLSSSEQQYQHNLIIAHIQQQDTILSDYFSDMSSLLLNKDVNLHDSQKGSVIRNIARARTLLALRRLDQDIKSDLNRKGNLLQFLYEAGLISKNRPKLDPIINLNQADLNGINLSNAKLDGIDLSGANMSNAQLKNVSLNGADLSGVDLSNADISAAILEGTTLKNANLSHTNFSYADLSHTDLSYTNIKNAIMYVTIFNSATLDYANLNNANLSYANLSAASMFLTDLGSADLSHAILLKAELRHAVLIFTNLNHANLSYSNLDRADLSNSDFSYANLSHACLYGVGANRYTNLSDANFSYTYLTASDIIKKDVAPIERNTQFDYATLKGNGPDICVSNTWYNNSPTT